MAVWLYAYGKNGLLGIDSEKIISILNRIEVDELKILDCIAEIKAGIKKYGVSIEGHYVKNRKMIEDQFYAQSDHQYKEYLASIKAPYIERDKIVDYFIADALEKEKKDKELLATTYEQVQKGLIKSKWTIEENNAYVNNLCNLRIYGGLRICFSNDLVSVSGPPDVFSYYGTFQKSISSYHRDFFHSLFKQIMTAFKSHFILYTHEWAGLDDEEDKGFNLNKLKEQSDWLNSTSSSIHNMSGFYFEEIPSTTTSKT